MIELNEKTSQDFLSREWVEKLLDAGVDMSDAKYIIAKDKLSMNDDEPDLTDYVWYKDTTEEVYDVCPTYTLVELFKKLRRDDGMEGGMPIIEFTASLLLDDKDITKVL